MNDVGVLQQPFTAAERSVLYYITAGFDADEPY